MIMRDPMINWVTACAMLLKDAACCAMTCAELKLIKKFGRFAVSFCDYGIRLVGWPKLVIIFFFFFQNQDQISQVSCCFQCACLHSSLLRLSSICSPAGNPKQTSS